MKGMSKSTKFHGIKIYSGSLDDIDGEERKNFNFINSLISMASHNKLVKLSNGFNFRRNFALHKYRDYREFTKAELYKASEDLTRTNINCSYEWLLDLPPDYENLNSLQSSEIYVDQLIADKAICKFVWKVIWSNHLTTEYLDTKIDFDNPKGDYPNIMNWKNFDKIVEFVGLCRWIGYLQSMIKANDFNKEIVIENRFPSLPDCFKNKELYKLVFFAPQVADLYDVLSDGTYHLKRGKKTYLACIAQRLLLKGALIESIKTNQDLARIFCPFFHVSFDSKHEKQFTPDRIATVPSEFYEIVINLIN